MTKASLPRRVIHALLLGVTVVFAAVVAYVTVILLQPREADGAGTVPQPLLTASPSIQLEDPSGLTGLIQSFPIPVLSGGTDRLLSASVSDAPFEDGFGRIATLTYAWNDTLTYQVTSIYPARAAALLGREDYVLSSERGALLVGLESVRMENATSIRLHIRTDQGLYAVTVPLSLQEDLSALTRTLQLITSAL
ncbi:MAG: hypothetical protein IJ083_13210 [Clostridia bacterium]|nr:hypothetical protein [Clostridia bacterium]